MSLLRTTMEAPRPQTALGRPSSGRPRTARTRPASAGRSMTLASLAPRPRTPLHTSYAQQPESFPAGDECSTSFLDPEISTLPARPLTARSMRPSTARTESMEAAAEEDPGPLEDSVGPPSALTRGSLILCGNPLKALKARKQSPNSQLNAEAGESLTELLHAVGISLSDDSCECARDERLDIAQELINWRRSFDVVSTELTRLTTAQRSSETSALDLDGELVDSQTADTAEVNVEVITHAAQFDEADDVGECALDVATSRVQSQRPRDRQPALTPSESTVLGEALGATRAARSAPVNLRTSTARAVAHSSNPLAPASAGSRRVLPAVPSTAKRVLPIPPGPTELPAPARPSTSSAGARLRQAREFSSRESSRCGYSGDFILSRPTSL
eukprot:m.681820 g.681820  ORF g.681820 m.681820 type:complete len:388 (-) comp58601_c0_seq9:4226-5389(-)